MMSGFHDLVRSESRWLARTQTRDTKTLVDFRASSLIMALGKSFVGSSAETEVDEPPLKFVRTGHRRPVVRRVRGGKQHNRNRRPQRARSSDTFDHNKTAARYAKTIALAGDSQPSFPTLRAVALRGCLIASRIVGINNVVTNHNVNSMPCHNVTVAKSK
ncbi:hypothetical protein PoB_004630800 [Plakobranchus ocellatus]|uniref:Uncharacterized protein n=1 Tax=Plakobranchus ocellatus TaxID=259542 RepID=A0AAV4BKX9_9GAST|nr:hypothetical protein PoB_004630800 [Plakobranchus ocellatus]